MLENVDPFQTKIWQKLQVQQKKIAKTNLRILFQKDLHRAQNYSLENEDIFVDYSKNLIDEQTMQLLFKLADKCGLKEAISAMFAGEKINRTENRAVLHTALRNF
ncbi:MAG: glucose-6-phosphate isomerase, partial [Candidatus Cloacimonadota bacterium]|nr:glucose-6-phosphate isomerase [Candidatus Cloacimonadota bacterium]